MPLQVIEHCHQHVADEELSADVLEFRQSKKLQRTAGWAFLRALPGKSIRVRQGAGLAGVGQGAGRPFFHGFGTYVLKRFEPTY